MMRFGHIEVFVTDPLKAKEFYEHVLGFEITEIQNEKYVWLKFGNNEFLLRPGKNLLQTDQYKDSNTGFVLYTDNLEETKMELLSRRLVFKGTDGSETCLTFTDPDGNWFQLVNPKYS